MKLVFVIVCMALIATVEMTTTVGPSTQADTSNSTEPGISTEPTVPPNATEPTTESSNTTEATTEPVTPPSNTTEPANTTVPTTESANTTEPTTEPATTESVPTVKPVAAQMFTVEDNKTVCFRLQAGLQFVVEYNTTDNQTMFSKPVDISSNVNVSGTCGNTTATMVIRGDDYILTITETRKDNEASSSISLNVTLDPINFPDAAQANTSMVFESSTVFNQSSVTTFYTCNTMQSVQFTNSRSVLYADQVRLQAFGLNNGSFTGQGVQCTLDPKPTPTPAPATSPGDNTYSVSNDYNNVTCIVLKGEISFTNINYTTTDGKNVTADQIVIPALNESTGNVNYSGNCDLDTGLQQLTIFFHNNWTLTLNFSLTPSQDSSMLSATDSQYYVRDVMLVYFLTPDIFPNASNAYGRMVSGQSNVTDTGFMAGDSNGGSYRCDAQQTLALDNGLFQTANLQYKAFNNDNSTDFSDDVTECSADDESNSIVPIAVGAALAGLVVIVLIAYLIGRRRSRRQGYESV